MEKATLSFRIYSLVSNSYLKSPNTYISCCGPSLFINCVYQKLVNRIMIPEPKFQYLPIFSTTYYNSDLI